MRRIRFALSVFFAALQEIFDEAAYTRFLERSGMKSSPAAYAQFCRERESASAPRPRCC
jgi:hypothetical protein